VFSDFKPVPKGLTFAQAVAILEKEEPSAQAPDEASAKSPASR